MATFNPADKKNALLVLSNGDLTATSSDAGGNNWVRSNLNRAGKRYCEIKIDTYSASHGVGIADASALTYPGANAQSFCLFGNGFGSLNNTFPDWGGGGTYNTFTTGSTVGMAVDLTAKKLWYRINGGNWNGNVVNNPATGTGGLDISAYAGTTHYVVVSGGAGFVSTANFGETAFQAAAPSGFLAWNSESTALASVPTMTASTKTVQAGIFATCVISGLNIGMTLKGPALNAQTTLPTYVSTSYATHTNLVMSLAGSVGDLMVMAAFISSAPGPGPPPIITPPAGWTQLFVPSQVSDGSTSGRLYAWYRARLESDTSPTFTHTSALSIGWMGAIKGASGVAPIDAQSFNAGTGLTSTGTSITTTKYDNEVAVWIAHDWLAGATRTPPSGWTEDLDEILYIAHKNLTSTGATGNVTMGSGGGLWQVALVAFTPASVTVTTKSNVSQTLTSPRMDISAGNATIPGQTIRIDNHLDVMEIYHSNVAVQAGLSFTQTSPPMTASTQDVSVITNDILSIDSPPLTIDTGGVTAIAFFPAETVIDSVPSIKARYGFVEVSIPIVVNATGEFMLASVGSVVGAIKPIINITAMPGMTASTQTVGVVGKANVLVAGDWGTAQAGNVTVIGKANVALASVPAMTSSTGGVTVKASQIISVSSPAMTAAAGDVTPIVPPGAGAWNHDRVGGPGALTNSDRTLVSVPSLSPATCFSTVAHGAGTFYAEVTIGGSPAGYVGLYNEASNAGTEIVLATGEVRQLPSGALTPTFAPIHSGDIIGIAYDGTDGEVWFRVNGGLWNNDASQGPVA